MIAREVDGVAGRAQSGHGVAVAAWGVEQSDQSPVNTAGGDLPLLSDGYLGDLGAETSFARQARIAGSALLMCHSARGPNQRRVASPPEGT